MEVERDYLRMGWVIFEQGQWTRFIKWHLWVIIFFPTEFYVYYFYQNFIFQNLQLNASNYEED